jgi:hypothetical protein
MILFCSIQFELEPSWLPLMSGGSSCRDRDGRTSSVTQINVLARLTPFVCCIFGVLGLLLKSPTYLWLLGSLTMVGAIGNRSSYDHVYPIFIRPLVACGNMPRHGGHRLPTDGKPAPQRKTRQKTHPTQLRATQKSSAIPMRPMVLAELGLRSNPAAVAPAVSSTMHSGINCVILARPARAKMQPLFIYRPIVACRLLSLHAYATKHRLYH